MVRLTGAVRRTGHGGVGLARLDIDSAAVGELAAPSADPDRAAAKWAGPVIELKK